MKVIHRTAKVGVRYPSGIRWQSCRVIRETSKKYIIMVDRPTGVPPGFSILMPGQEMAVPKSAVKFPKNKE